LKTKVLGDTKIKMDRKIKIISITAASIGVAAAGIAILGRFMPNISPFRSDVVSLINDVNEKVTILKATIKEEPKQAKELLKSIAQSIKDDIANSSVPVGRNEFTECNEADAKRTEAEISNSNANSWRDNQFAGNIVSTYENNAQAELQESYEKENECNRQITEAQKYKDELKRNANGSKQLIKISGEKGAHTKYVPTYSYKIIVTDVNGKSNVINQTVTCLNSNAEYVFSKERRKNLAPHSFVSFSKPSQMTIVASVEPLQGASVYGGSVIPTADAINYSSQEVCKYKGHIGIEKDFLK